MNMPSLTKTEKLIILATVLITILLSVAGMGYVLIKSKEYTNVAPVELTTTKSTPPNPPVSITQASPTPPLVFKTYIDEDYGFSFDYLAGLTLKQYSQRDIAVLQSRRRATGVPTSIQLSPSQPKPSATILKSISLEAYSEIENKQYPLLNFNILDTPFTTSANSLGPPASINVQNYPLENSDKTLQIIIDPLQLSIREATQQLIYAVLDSLRIN